MPPMIPTELEPYFNALIPKASTYPWLNQFYFDHIHVLIKQIIEVEMMPEPALQLGYPEPVSTLKKIRILQGFFDPNNHTKQIYAPLVKPFHDLDHLVKILEDDIILAWVRGDMQEPLYNGLPSYAPEVFRGILTREILVYIQNQIHALQSTLPKEWVHNAHDIDYWSAKELRNLEPVITSLELDTKRFSLLHDPNAQDIDFGELLGIAWYFVNGTDRIPMFLQYELNILRRMKHALRLWVHNIAYYKNEAKLIIIGLPLASCWFLLDCLYLCFLPYRFVRTMVNELTDLLKHGFNHFVAHYLNIKQQDTNTLKLIQQILVWGAYATLLWTFGLPFLPNPFAWQPHISLTTLLMIPVTFMAVAALGGMLNNVSAYLFPDSYQAIKDSASNLEKKVEEGIESLQKAHGELFQLNPKPVLNAYARHKAPVKQEEAAAQPNTSKFYAKNQP